MTLIHALLLGLATAGIVGALALTVGAALTLWVGRALWRWLRSTPPAPVARHNFLVEIPRLAHEKHGSLSVTDVVESLGITQAQAHDALAKLVNNRVCRVQCEVGSTTYLFDKAAPPTQVIADRGLLAGRYRIVRPLKEGGMGAVYEALDTKLADSPCAIKEILASAAHGEHAEYVQSRFFEEMKALVALDHPAIPKVRDYLTQDSTIYIVMELVRGKNLEDAVETTEQAVKDVLQLLDCLSYLHSQAPPILHRDVKPANVIRDESSGRVKLVDFGLARKMQDKTDQTMVGTPGFCAPEQTMGNAEPRSDIYSAGVTFYYMLTRISPTTLFFQLKDGDNVPEELRAIVARATQMDPAARYATADEMAADLRRWLGSVTAA